jgi:hypothetical protein
VPLLIPGLGAQGGDSSEIQTPVTLGTNRDIEEKEI